MRFLLGLCFFLIIIGLIVIGDLRWDVELLEEKVKELEEKDKDKTMWMKFNFKDKGKKGSL